RSRRRRLCTSPTAAITPSISPDATSRAKWPSIATSNAQPRSRCGRLPDRPDRARAANVCIAGHKWQVDNPSGSTDERVERIAVEPQLVGHIHLLGGYIERLIGGVAEQLFEERSNAAAQIDARDTREETAFPAH